MEPREQRLTFYDGLYAECREEAQVNLRALAKEDSAKSTLIPLVGGRIGVELEAFVQAFNNEKYFGVYHAVASRNGGGTKDHIVEIPALWVDIDFKSVSEAVAKRKLDEFYFTPSALIASGGGLHPYWFLKEPATKEEIGPVDRALRVLCGALDGDIKCAEAGHILRVPGTVNYKYDPGRPVTLIYCEPERRYSYQDILDFFPEPTVQDFPEPATGTPKNLPPCIEYIITEKPYVKDKANYNQLVLTLVTYFLEHDWDKKDVWQAVAPFIEGYPHSDTYKTKEQRISKWRREWNTVKGQGKWVFDCGFVKGLQLPELNCDACEKSGVYVYHEPLVPEDTCVIQFVDTEPPPREYLFDELKPRRMVGGIMGMGGTSKSFLFTTLALGLATGQTTLFRFTPTRPFRVLALFAEDPTDEMHRRIYHTVRYHFPNLTPGLKEMIRVNLGVKSVLGEMNDLMRIENDVRMRTNRYDWLKRSIENHEAEVLMLDPKSQFYGLNELSNEDNAAWVNTLGSFVQEYDMNVIFTHHVAQSMRDELHQMAARGGTALPDGCRWVANLRLMTEKDAQKYEIANRKEYVEFDVSKNNYVGAFPRTIFFKRGTEGVLEPISLEGDRIKQLAEELCKLLVESYAERGITFSRRDIRLGKKCEQIRKDLKGDRKSLPRTDIDAAIDYALENDMARAKPEGRTEHIFVTEMEDIQPELVI
jgi:replicative DNA helicase